MDFELIFYWTVAALFAVVVLPVAAIDILHRRQRRRERRNGRRKTDKIKL